jgi:c-di-GMP-binding flagellar brake protein YcgR
MWEFNERRVAPRHTTRLRCRLLFPATETAEGVRRPAVPPLVGYTRDISASGLGVIVAGIRGTHVHLTDLDSVVLVELDLPSGQIEVRTSPARVERLAGDGADTGYLVGLRITKINESLLPRFEQYLYALG